MRSQRKAFTLIELLVVIAIIVALLAMLMPSMRMAIDASQRAVCQSNLHQMGIGNLGWASDHFGMVMISSPRSWPYDIHRKLDNTSKYAPPLPGTDVWSIEGINPYVTSFADPANNNEIDSTGIAVCPSTDSSVINQWHKVLKNSAHVEIVYTYFGALAERFDDPAYGGGGGTNWNIKNGAQKILMTRRMGGSSDRIWMSDVLYHDDSDAGNGINPWRYNHGKYGWSLNWLMDGNGDPMYPNFTGLNQMMGDGHVRWKGLDEFYSIDLMWNLAYPGPYTRAGKDMTMF